MLQGRKAPELRPARSGSAVALRAIGGFAWTVILLLLATQFSHDIYDAHTAGEQGEARWFGNGHTRCTGKSRCRCCADCEQRHQRERDEAAHRLNPGTLMCAE